ncbi:phosphate ABC transporter permease PstA [Amycolatopsis alkalitolerans]|uniref:Phosphate transport system permease protein PstA n=1 Tax=Amycolatopsis alkalitolerans TaxID=2547244 RepID=A0A5C4M4K0_9PSEU|nr:phosphate ABC transporter permease PstA [Amycolatopsis alkalitolerans]TNC26140.1 phosphate ABC transporter permease PstA [Amycolatopsis alkalitolerans]
MTVALEEPLGANPLTRPRLTWVGLAATALGAVAITALLFLVTPLSGYVAFVLIAAVLYVIALTVVSALVEGWRHAKDRLMMNVLLATVLFAVLALVGVLGYTVFRGLSRFDGTFLTHSMRSVAEADPDGGAYHAIIGTLEQVGIATAIAAPLGILVAVYLVEYSSGRLGRVVSFLVDVMTGLPSIVAGLFVLALWIVLLAQPYSGFAGSLALIVLMLPTVIRSTEEMLKLVPAALREASYALGIAKWITVVRVVLPTATAGIVTGVMLAISRVMGETAPVLLTVFGAQSINFNPFSDPQGSLPLFVFTEAGQPNNTALDRAWAGALTLILIVLLLNLIARTVARFARVK